MNKQQRESLAKFCYDIGKGFLLFGVTGVLTNKIGFAYFMLVIVMALYFVMGGYDLEKELNDD